MADYHATKRSAVTQQYCRGLVLHADFQEPLRSRAMWEKERVLFHYISGKLAEFFQTKFNQGRSRFDLVIGSALGLSEKIKERADLLLSLSKLTFPHELTRLILSEQLYRAMSILQGSKYHK